MFNPQSFLTAVCQSIAQTQTLQLDHLQLTTEVTKKVGVEEVSTPAKDGAFVIGLYLEGASWNLAKGFIENSKVRELFSPMPVINVKAVVAEKIDKSLYSCPVYKTTQRGATYVFSGQLRCRGIVAKWTLAGVALILDVFE